MTRVGIGWLITALAIMLGAPFWFDVLNRIMIIRSTVKPHEKSPEEPSHRRRFEQGAAAGGQLRQPAGSAAAPAPASAPAPAADSPDAAPQPAT